MDSLMNGLTIEAVRSSDLAYVQVCGFWQQQ